MKRRRLSICSLAAIRSPRCQRAACVILLNEVLSVASSPSDLFDRHLDGKIALGDIVGRADQPADRRNEPVGDPMPIQMAAASTIKATPK